MRSRPGWIGASKSSERSAAAPNPITWLLFASVALAPGCDDSPTGPDGTAWLTLTYSQPITTPVGPPDSTGCAHHYAPSQYSIESSWGARTRLDGSGRAIDLGPAPTGRTLWVRVIDVTWCLVEPVSPVARAGVRLNGVELTRVADVEGQLPALEFSLEGDGRVLP
jgi:hypothetical protein